jgi:hypothetical protein
MRKFLFSFILLATATSAKAAPIEFDSFGQFDGYSAGVGIPNDAVATSAFNYLGLDFTMGLTVTERCGNPPVTNDGNGTFTATSGSNTPYCSSSEGATWNFGFYFGFDNSDSVSSFLDLKNLLSVDSNERLKVNLDYDVNASNSVNFGTINLLPTFFEAIVRDGETIYDPAAVSVIQGSQNLLFNFLYDASSVTKVPNDGATFNSNVPGLYDFRLRAKYGTENNIVNTNTRIRVNVVPEPSVLAMFALGLMGLGARRFIN